MKKNERKDLILSNRKNDVAHSAPICFCLGSVDNYSRYVPLKKWRDGKCSCVFACPKFQTYQVTMYGVRIIPFKAQCPYVVGSCYGDHWFVRDTGKYVAHERARRGRDVPPVIEYVLGKKTNAR